MTVTSTTRTASRRTKSDRVATELSEGGVRINSVPPAKTPEEVQEGARAGAPARSTREAAGAAGGVGPRALADLSFRRRHQDGARRQNRGHRRHDSVSPRTTSGASRNGWRACAPKRAIWSARGNRYRKVCRTISPRPNGRFGTPTRPSSTGNDRRTRYAPASNRTWRDFGSSRICPSPNLPMQHEDARPVLHNIVTCSSPDECSLCGTRPRPTSASTPPPPFKPAAQTSSSPRLPPASRTSA